MVGAVTVAKGLTAIGSLGCLIGGIILLEMSTEKAHESKAIELEKSIGAWTSHRAEFSHLNVSGSFGRDNVVARLPAEEISDRDLFVNAEDISDYKPLVYRAGAIPRDFLPSLRFGQIEWEEDVGGDGHHAHVMKFYFRIGDSFLSTEAFPLVKATAQKGQRGLYNHCRRRKGTFSDGKCWKYSRLTQLCIQVRLEGSQWQLAPRVPGKSASYGCEWEEGNWTAAIYKDVELVPIDASAQVISFKDIDIIIRSAHDPFLKAVEVTEGSLDFGLTAEEERWLAIVLLVMASMLAVPPACALCAWWYKRRKRGRPKSPSITRPRPRKPDPESVGMKYAVGYDQDESYYDD